MSSWFFLVCVFHLFFPAVLPTVATLPSALYCERFFSLGASWCSRFSRCCHLIFDLASLFKEEGWVRRLSQSPKLGGRNSAVRILGLRCCAQHTLVAKRFVGLAVDPQAMQQDGQLPSHHRSFLPILASALQRGPECGAHFAPSSFLDRDLLPLSLVIIQNAASSPQVKVTETRVADLYRRVGRDCVSRC